MIRGKWSTYRVAVSAHPFLECGQWSVYLLKLQEILHSLISDCFYSMINFFTNKLSILSLSKGLFLVSNDQLLVIFRITRFAQSPKGHATHAPRPQISASPDKSKTLRLWWKVKPRWPPMEGSLVRQFKSPSPSYTSVLVLPRDFLNFLKSFLWECTQNMSSKDRSKFKNSK